MYPQITSHLPSDTVHCRLLLVTGTITAPDLSGDIWVLSHACSFPPQPFPVRNSSFKALLHLSPGENNLTLDFRPSPSPSSSYKSVFDIIYLPLLQNPPLHLAIIVAKDSPLRYDDVPGATATLESAQKKLRLAGYLWQAFTANEMYAQGLGHRTFRLDEAWLPDTLSKIDSPRRNTARITVLRSKHSAAYIRDSSRAQQNHASKDKNNLFNVALEAVRDHPEFKVQGGEKVHVAAMFLDSVWDRGKALITGHAALGCEDAGGVALAIFGSHTLFAWPSCIEEIVPAFNDPRPVDTRYCGIDAEGKTYFMAANIGIGAFLHECGHLFGCPHQPFGVMRRDYTRLHRSFSVLSPGETCHWHRHDTLRFLRHLAFTLPSDPPCTPGYISASPVPAGILITSPTPIHLIEFRTSGNEHPTSTIEPSQTSALIPYPPTDTGLTILSRSPVLTIPSTSALLPSSGTFRTPLVGTGKENFQRILIPAPLTRLRIHSGTALDGLEFFGTSSEGVLFGTRGGGKVDFVFQPGEELRGFVVRSGAWVDAVRVRTDRRWGEWRGGAGGGEREVIVPPGCRIVAVVGEVGQWVLGLGAEYVDAGKPPPVPPR
jgi:hypothetical protein